MSKETTKLWRQNNPVKWKAINARYRMKLKIDVLTHYANGKPSCYCCGETQIHFLGLDHMNNDGMQERKTTGGGHAAYRWLKTNRYPIKNYKIACQNCNSARYYYGECPHKQMVLEENPILYLEQFLTQKEGEQ